MNHGVYEPRAGKVQFMKNMQEKRGLSVIDRLAQGH